MMKDLFEKLYANKGPLGKWGLVGYHVSPKPEGPI